jgi:putative membrane protein
MTGALIGFLITAVVTAISLIIISYIPFLGIEVDNFRKALTAGIVFGVLNGLASLICAILKFPLFVILSLGVSLLVVFLINVIIFGLTAVIVTGFRLRNGVLSAVLGAIALSIVNSILFSIFGRLFFAASA